LHTSLYAAFALARFAEPFSIYGYDFSAIFSVNFAAAYRKFSIHGASHLGRHLFVSKLVNAGVNICLVQKLANHKNISTTQHYFNANEQMLANAVENVRV